MRWMWMGAKAVAFGVLAGGLGLSAGARQDAPAQQTPPAAKQKTSPAAEQQTPPSAARKTPPSAAEEPVSGATANPFPEAESEAAAKSSDAAEKGASSGPGAASSREPVSSSRTRMQGLDLLGEHDSRISNGAGGIVQDPALAKKDVKVGKFYMNTGDYVGAYSRFKEATEVGPGNAEAVFWLAQAARKTSHLDEAEANYKLYLEADPNGKLAKDAKKALAELAGK